MQRRAFNSVSLFPDCEAKLKETTLIDFRGGAAAAAATAAQVVNKPFVRPTDSTAAPVHHLKSN